MGDVRQKHKMKTHAFGFPPIGECAGLPSSSVSIPDRLRESIRKEYEALYPDVYILAAYDPEADILALYDRTREIWFKRSDITEVVLTPTGPAKGPGYIEIGVSLKATTYPTGAVWTSVYSEALHKWMRKKADALAHLIESDVRETMLYADC